MLLLFVLQNIFQMLNEKQTQVLPELLATVTEASESHHFSPWPTDNDILKTNKIQLIQNPSFQEEL